MDNKMTEIEVKMIRGENFRPFTEFKSTSKNPHPQIVLSVSFCERSKHLYYHLILLGSSVYKTK